MATQTPTTNPLRQEDAHKHEGRETSGTMGSMADKARQGAQNIGERAQDAVSSMGDKAECATHNVGRGMENLAGTLREKLPREGMLGAAGSTIASGLESSGRYLEEEGLSGLAQDLTNFVRRNPIPALLAGVTLGFFLAQITKRS